MSSTSWISCCFIALFYICEGANILGLFPFPTKSRFTFDNAVMKSLIEAGHNVTVVTPFPKQAVGVNYTKIIDISKNEFIYMGQTSYEKLAAVSSSQLVEKFSKEELHYCNKLLTIPEIQEIFKSNKKLYDVIFVEIILLYKCYFPMAKKMNVPVIGTVTLRSSTYADNAIGNHIDPASVLIGMGRLSPKDSLYNRLKNIENYIVPKWNSRYYLDIVLERFYEENVKVVGSLDEYRDSEPAMIFYNNHASFLPKPAVPNAIEIGGIAVENPKPLQKNIKKFIEEADHGVILFTFGSLVRAAASPPQTIEAFKTAFAEIPQRVIWKFEEKIPDISPNVMLMDWVPQRDILEHKNIRGFITHCGIGGVYEAIKSATPIIAVPLCLDQYANAILLEEKQVAVHVDVKTVSKQKVLKALNAIINDTRYYENMQRLSNAFKDRPMTPQQSVVYWTEYVIRHNGAEHMRTAAKQLNWFQYLLLDVLSIVLVCLIFITIFFWKMTKVVTLQLNSVHKFFHKNGPKKIN